MDKFYISTAIAYASAKPHIGNTYEIVLADAIARYQRLKGKDVYFQTGTDEHGQKVQNNANEAGLEPQKYVDDISKEIKRIWDLMNTSYDKFIRTTDETHKEKVSEIFEKLYKKGDIYKGEYNGLYCTPCESFFSETQITDGKCPDCGREVISAREEAYFLKVNNYTAKLIEHIENHNEFLQPESRRNEMLNSYLKPGLQDLCVSRTSFSWGVPVTFDPGHVVYVWIDALSNYITFLGYDSNGDHSDEFNKYWPADIHLIGKDIFKFHAIYWPIILLALDLPLPKTVYGHPFITMGDAKMSKSTGNVLYADDLVESFGVDPIRYCFLHEIPFANDGLITKEIIIDRTNSDLVNTLGNLVNRTVSMSHKYFDGIVVKGTKKEEIDNDLINLATDTRIKVDTYMSEYQISKAVDSILELLRRANKYVDETTPWILAKDETKKDRLATVIYNLLETIRYSAVLLQPFIPETANRIFKQINCSSISYESISEFGNLGEGIKLNEPTVLFERIDKESKMKEIN